MSATAFQRLRREAAATVEPTQDTTDDFDNLTAKDVRELAQMHGLEIKGVKIADLRDQLRRAMYLNV